MSLLRLFPILVPFFLLVSSCGENDSTAEQADTTAVTQERQGISVAEWKAQGGPNPTQPWGEAEMLKGVEVYQSMRRTGTHDLPRKSGEGSEIFARLISPDNLNFLADDSIPSEARMESLGRYMTGLTQIYLIYTGAAMGGEPYEDEVIEVMIVLIGTEARFMEILQDYLATVDPERKEDELFKSGMRQVQDGLTQSLKGVITVLRDKEVFTRAQLERLAGSLRKDGVDLIAGLDEEHHAQLESEARATLAATDDPVIQDALREAFPELAAE